MYFYDTMLSQYSTKRVIKEFGEEDVEAGVKELQQLHDMKTVEHMSPETMNREQRNDSLRYLMFLLKKRSGWIKDRGRADGRKQRLYARKKI